MKKTITTLVFALVMTLGSSFAFANDGIIIAGRGVNNDTCSATKDGIIIAGRDGDGIIIAGREGILVSDLVGIIIAGFSADTTDHGCTQSKGGILVGD